ncbi:hypothetical protein X762_32005 [Mesorhizobium sp. LSHC426A00]|nr:hypothetical protein X762_32005 [Mesorhizobium sp. LSHC426A00]
MRIFARAAVGNPAASTPLGAAALSFVVDFRAMSRP